MRIVRHLQLDPTNVMIDAVQTICTAQIIQAKKDFYERVVGDSPLIQLGAFTIIIASKTQERRNRLSTQMCMLA